MVFSFFCAFIWTFYLNQLTFFYVCVVNFSTRNLSWLHDLHFILSMLVFDIRSCVKGLLWEIFAGGELSFALLHYDKFCNDFWAEIIGFHPVTGGKYGEGWWKLIGTNNVLWLRIIYAGKTLYSEGMLHFNKLATIRRVWSVQSS